MIQKGSGNFPEKCIFRLNEIGAVFKLLQVKIIGVGKIKENYIREGIAEYVKRLKPYLRLEIIEVPDEPCPENLSPAEEQKVKEKEGERILKALSPSDYVILLDIKGKTMDSEGFSRFLDDLALKGQSSVAFVIGGSLGVSSSLYGRADYRWSFSPLTFPHQLMRLILLEQIYRAVRISRGEPYHK